MFGVRKQSSDFLGPGMGSTDCKGELGHGCDMNILDCSSIYTAEGTH